MGLYDTIKCKFPLPFPKDRQELEKADFNKIFTFQTKNLGKRMSNYEIREDGTMWIQSFDAVVVNGEYERKNPTWLRYNPHNLVMEIYDLYCAGYEDDLRLKNDYWVKYEVEFRDSVVSNVKLLEFRGKNRAKSDAALDNLFGEMKEDVGFFKRIGSKIRKFLERHLNG
jgi:hypothetical protein